MLQRTISHPLFAAAIVCGLAACGGNDYSPPPAPAPAPVPAPAPGNAFALTASNRLISFNRDTPGAIATNVQITGLMAGESVLGIDFRPADRMLYALGSGGRVYTIHTTSGAATLNSTLAADPTDATSPFTALAGADFGVDFNPVPDRMRVVSNTGQNLRINVDTGATTTDGSINGGAAGTAVSGAAYTNAFAGAGTTTLFDIDSGTDTLFTQNPPNDGTLASPVSLGVDASNVNGFDIDGQNNGAFAALTVGGATGLYRINLTAASNAATLVGAIGVAETIRGLALAPIAAPTAFAATADNRLVSFAPTAPNTFLTNIAITGLTGGESVLGIDVRPADNQLYAITSAARIYTIDTMTGAATLKSMLAADPADATAPFTALAGTMFGVDFNPFADRLRVVSDTGQNLRINVDTGATTTDGIINRASGAAVVTGVAYTNNFRSPAATMLFDLDTMANVLTLQSPPNDGSLIDTGALGVDIAGDVHFDIAGGANGLGIAALRTTASGPYTLYRVNVATGAATLIGGNVDSTLSLIGGTAGPVLRGLAIRF